MLLNFIRNYFSYFRPGIIMNSSSPPPAPDYKGAAEAQGASSIAAIREQTAQNRVDQYNPWGSLTWGKKGGFDQAGYDAAMKAYQDSWVAPTAGSYMGGSYMPPGQDAQGNYVDGGYGSNGYVPGTDGYYRLPAPNRADFDNPIEWTQNVNLNPELQGALDSQIAMQKGRSDIALGLMPQVEQAITQPLDWNSFQDFGNAPTASNLQFAGPAPTLQMANNAPNLLHNLNTIGLYDQGEFKAQNLPQVGQLTRDGIPGMPTYDGKFVQDIQNQALEFMSADQRQQQTALEAKLAAQGVTPGSAAYNNAMRQFNDQQARDKYQALNVAMNQAQGMFNSGLAANAQGFNQNRDIFNSQLAANQNAFGQQNQAWQNNFNLDNLQFNQRLTEHNFANQAMAAQNGMNLANLGFNNQSMIGQNQMNNANTVLNNQAMQQQFQQQQAIADYQNNLRIQQIKEAQMRQLQPLNNLNALLTGQQVGQPQFNSFNTAGAAQPINYLGAAQAQYGADLGNYNAQQAASAANMNGLFSLGGSLLGGAGAAGGFGNLFSFGG